jgi:prolyl-tRNA synthetase
MRYSQYFIPTLKETPADAEVISHQLMLRAGLIRKVASGIYNYLPLGLRTIRKVEKIVRDEMDRAGALEILMPMANPAELWQESGRWEKYGKELLRFKDRKEAEFCMGPTHEEVVTDIVRREVRSYRQMPLNLYQIQTKFRDEIRPRFGLMRGREFIMKDAYSFDVNEAGAIAAYDKMYQAYRRIFARCGLNFRAVEADSGAIGGNYSHEFMVLADSGEDAIVSCNGCEYAANIEKAEARPLSVPEHSDPRPLEKVSTPGQKSIEEVSTFLGIAASETVKCLIFVADGEPVAVLLRGDHELNEIKLSKVLGANELALADEALVSKVTSAPVGFAGPIGLSIRVVADFAVEGLRNVVVGANAADLHFKNANPGRDFTPNLYADLRNVVHGDLCPRCAGGVLEMWRGVEVGHVFKLGTRYSEAMKACFLDSDGKEQFVYMGCYGIGIGRTAAAAIEQNHDANGIIWPMAIAPFEVIVTMLNPNDASVRTTAEALYAELTALGVDALLDDRDERAGSKFADAELIGIPLRVTVGARGVKDGVLELQERRGGEKELVAIDAMAAAVAEKVRLAKA